MGDARRADSRQTPPQNDLNWRERRSCHGRGKPPALDFPIQDSAQHTPCAGASMEVGQS